MSTLTHSTSLAQNKSFIELLNLGGISLDNISTLMTLAMNDVSMMISWYIMVRVSQVIQTISSKMGDHDRSKGPFALKLGWGKKR